MLANSPAGGHAPDLVLALPRRRRVAETARAVRRVVEDGAGERRAGDGHRAVLAPLDHQRVVGLVFRDCIDHNQSVRNVSLGLAITGATARLLGVQTR